MGEKDMSDVPEAMEPLVEAAADQAETVLKTIEARVNSLSQRTAEATAQISTGRQILDAMDEYAKESGKIAWKSLKAFGVGALSLIPVLGGVGEAGSAMTEAAILEGATPSEAEALAKGAIVSESGKVAPSLIQVLGEKGATKLTEVLKKLDPFPDVPRPVVVASGAAEALGLEGAGAIPAGIQLTKNEFDKIKLEFRTAKKIAHIIKDSPEAAKVKEKMHDFSGSVKNTIHETIEKMKRPEVRMAAAKFSPAAG